MLYKGNDPKMMNNLSGTPAGEALLTDFNETLTANSQPQDHLDWLMLRTGMDEGLGELVEIPTNDDAVVASSFQTDDDRIWQLPYDQAGVLTLFDVTPEAAGDLTQNLMVVCEDMDTEDDVDWVLVQDNGQLWFLAFTDAAEELTDKLATMADESGDARLNATVAINVVATGFQID